MTSLLKMVKDFGMFKFQQQETVRMVVKHLNENTQMSELLYPNFIEFLLQIAYLYFSDPYATAYSTVNRLFANYPEKFQN